MSWSEILKESYVKDPFSDKWRKCKGHYPDGVHRGQQVYNIPKFNSRGENWDWVYNRSKY
jgi:hypothetical protein